MKLEYKSKPMLIQRKSIRFGLRHGCWGLYSEMGTGKTLAAIYWAMQTGAWPVAVLGRSDDLATWQDEIRTHSNCTFVNVCAKKSRKARIKALATPGAQFYLMTYDSVKQLEPQLRRMTWGTVIADEFTEIKHPGTKRTRAVFRVYGATPHRLGMTGTPVTNSAEDVFSQMKFIDGGKRFGTSLWEFRNKYFWPEPQGYRWHLFPEELATLRRKIYEVCIRFRKEDALDLPPKVFLKKPCGMTPDQARVYKTVKNDFEIELESGNIWEFDYVIQQFTKLLQITGGFYYNEDKVPVPLPCDKLDTFKWMLGLHEFRRTKKIVIWATFNYELERIRDMAAELGYHGTMFWKHTPDRKAARERFRDDPGCQLFIGQVASGIGMNELKVADTVFYYSRSTKLVHRMQSEDRTHRKGSEVHDRVRYIDLIVPGTLDAKVYGMLRRYKDIADQIVDGKTALEMIRS